MNCDGQWHVKTKKLDYNVRKKRKSKRNPNEDEEAKWVQDPKCLHITAAGQQLFFDYFIYVSVGTARVCLVVKTQTEVYGPRTVNGILALHKVVLAVD